MSEMKLRFFFMSLLLCIPTVYVSAEATRTNGKAFFAQRSQGDNLARRFAGEEFLLYECEGDAWLQGVGSVAFEYTRSFDNNDLGAYFSFNNTASMLFAGDNASSTAVSLRDVRAEYFGLASNFEGTVNFRPKVENGIADINIRFNLNRMLYGLYFEIGIPVTWTRFGMYLTQETANPGTTIDLGLGVNNPEAFSHSIIQAYMGQNGNVPIADLSFANLEYARIDGTHTKSGVADLKFILGYNIICNDCGHFGLNLRGSAPTGTRPKGEFVFEPILGNGNHGTLGAGVSAHYILWEDDCKEQSFSVWLEGEIHHLFTAQQMRTFDLTPNGVGSRYIQLKQFNPDDTFTGNVIPAANITTMKSDVSIAAAGEVMLMFDYQRCGFLFDVGYTIWGRSKEKIKLKGSITERYGVAGKIDAVSENRTKSDATISTDGTVDGISLADNVYVIMSDLNVASAASPAALAHKVFANLNYMWDLCDAYAPFVGLGGEAEFSGIKNNALSQWGVWGKFGVAFSAF